LGAALVVVEVGERVKGMKVILVGWWLCSLLFLLLLWVLTGSSWDEVWLEQRLILDCY